MKNILSLLMGAVLMVVMTSAGRAQPDSPRISVLVHTAKPYKSVIRAIEGLGGTVNIQYVNVDGLAVQISADALAALSGIRGIEAVEKDRIINLPKSRDGNALMTRYEGTEVLGAATVRDRLGPDPANYYSYLSGATGASDTWADTASGANSIVAVIDTGTSEFHACLAGRVIAGPDFSTDGDSFPDEGDVGGPHNGSTLDDNHWHGTFVGGVIANFCGLFDLPTNTILGHALETHLPAEAFTDNENGTIDVPLFGMAPAASIYAVKVFPFTGAGAANFRISAAIDHVISAKLSGDVDVDVINMSLGGATLFDGRTIQEQLVDAATAAGITVVISSGNEGPTPGSVAAPGTAYTAVTVAAGADTVHSRVFFDWSGGPGLGVLVYPVDERLVADFSNRGPSADGRNAVDLIATGVLNFSGFTPGSGLGWASGTSFSAPTVAGAAALLSSWRNITGAKVSARDIKNALTAGAVPMSSDWPEHAQGHGWVQVANSLALLQSGRKNRGERHDLSDPLKPTILLGSETEHTETITVGRGRTFDFLLEITEETETVEVIIELAEPVPQGPVVNSWELYIKSAKHGGTGSLVDSANFIDDATVTIGDGTIDHTGLLSGVIAPAPMEPGLMKVTLEPDWTNNIGDLTATVTIRRTNGPQTSNAGGITATFADLDNTGLIPLNVPEGTARMTFDLSWKHDWSKVSVNDFDIIVINPAFDVFFFDGATLNAPERQIIDDPEAGTWFVFVDAFSVNKGKDPWVLNVTLEPIEE